ncbi:unnamed protein product [Pleuronectes platessa]|uniref:Uncharacterized protein n=1 Tax=Pleuronectes platessa TaxID=8262 RepID=A0A9N7VS63_PLEPL|nr:unnamed protein product [Pleuronectes platessa]
MEATGQGNGQGQLPTRGRGGRRRGRVCLATSCLESGQKKEKKKKEERRLLSHINTNLSRDRHINCYSERSLSSATRAK